jgi:nicotinate-nucleotide adenylyltransferase
MASLWAVSTAQVDRVIWAPCHVHPFGKDLAPFDDRVEMCRLAALGLPGAEVSTLDRDAGAQGRTLPLLRALRAQRPDDEVLLLVGADLLAERARWSGYPEIERLARFLVVGRAGFAGGEGPVLPAVSSSAIRAALARRENVSALLPRPVLDYVRQRGLYEAR